MSRVSRGEGRKKEKRGRGRIFGGTSNIFSFFFNRRERERDEKESNDDDYSKITGDILFELSFFKYFT